ncbi:hypothetical protein Pint_04767 [Pistacia integerrima]|uniref:Uncharacterized protein n=1 Tax=Pistacia integerrima TaxID=434235 RepID=A0ACC0Z0Q3_9ROSI|nr:hypothetical protein Pint_04767 [Pistacia integerrima]
MTNPKLISSFRLSSLLRLQKDPKLALQLFQNPNPDTSQTPPVKPFRYSHLNYDLIITKLGRAKMFDEMRQILHQLKQDTRISPEEIIFCNVISFYGRARLCEHALLVFDEMPSFRVQRTVKSFNSLLSAILKCRRFDKMREVFARMEEDGSADSCSYNILIHGCVVNGKLKEAWSVFGAMLRRGLKADEVTFGTLIYGLCLELRLKEASKLKDDMVRVYKEGKLSEANDLLEDMPRRGCAPDVVSYRILFDGLCDGMQFKAAASILDEMIFKGHVPRSTSVHKFINGYASLSLTVRKICIFSPYLQEVRHSEEVSQNCFWAAQDLQAMLA